MNALAPLNNALVPTSMTEAMKLAEMMASAKLVPKDLQKSPADCLMVIQQAVRWQMDPFAVAQECSVIQGKLMHSGKLVAAVVNARGNLAERLSYSYSGENGSRAIIVKGRLQGETEPRSVEVRLDHAKTNNRVWQSQPDQQLMYHGCRVWARRHTPELMLGVWSPEEFDEPANNNGNNAQPIVIEHQSEPPPQRQKRTREDIQAHAKMKRDETRERIPADLAQIETLRALEAYKAAVLTADFMASLGTAQYAVEQMVGEREEELQAAERQAEEAAALEETPSEKAEYVRQCHEFIAAEGDEKALLGWWNRKAERETRTRLLTGGERQDLMKRVMERRSEIIKEPPNILAAG